MTAACWGVAVRDIDLGSLASLLQLVHGGRDRPLGVRDLPLQPVHLLVELAELVLRRGLERVQEVRQLEQRQLDLVDGVALRGRAGGQRRSGAGAGSGAASGGAERRVRRTCSQSRIVFSLAGFSWARVLLAIARAGAGARAVCLASPGPAAPAAAARRGSAEQAPLKGLRGSAEQTLRGTQPLGRMLWPSSRCCVACTWPPAAGRRPSLLRRVLSGVTGELLAVLLCASLSVFLGREPPERRLSGAGQLRHTAGSR